MVKKAKGIAGGEESKRDNVKWMESMDLVLIDALLEQQLNDNRCDGTFTTTAYSNILKICRDELNLSLDKDHLKNCIKTLKNHFNVCHDLFKSLSGFAWNPISKFFEAEFEVWKALLEAKPHAKKWRSIEINHYDKLYDLFAKDRANGEGAMTAKEKGADIEQHDEVSFDSFDLPSATVHSQVTNSSKGGSKRKLSIMNSFDKHVEVLDSRIKNVAEAIRERNIITEKGITILEKGRPHLYFEEEIYAELVSIGTPNHLLLDALLFLGKSQSKVRSLFAFPRERRLEMLLKMMCPTNEA
ncbi:hypothetical protein UlMin_029438 [Ulmus minor]